MLTVGLWTAFTLLVAAGAFAYSRKQNAAAEVLGGFICKPKVFWLGFTVLNWFLLAPLVTLSPKLATANLAAPLGVFCISIWIRGIAELTMLYKNHSWRPVWGIFHNISSIAILGFALKAALDSSATAHFSLAVFQVCYVAFLLLSFAVESHYAKVFAQLAGQLTMGSKGVWFASAENQKFKMIIAVTRAWNYVFTIVWLAITAGVVYLQLF